jgi:hypothetical protein
MVASQKPPLNETTTTSRRKSKLPVDRLSWSLKEQ